MISLLELKVKKHKKRGFFSQQTFSEKAWYFIDTLELERGQFAVGCIRTEIKITVIR